MLTLQSSNDRIVQIPYREEQRVGILLSGGMDSGLLLNLLDIACTDCTFVIFTMDKPDGSLKYSADIIKKSKLRNKWEQHIVKGGKENEIASLGITGKTAFRHILDDYITDLDVLYSGNTSNPPQSLMSTTAAPDRSVANKAVDKYSKFEIPFIELNKAETIDLVLRHELEWLFEASHTCTEFDEGRCYQQTETIHCWQCMERQWGFIENNIRDPGTN